MELPRLSPVSWHQEKETLLASNANLIGERNPWRRLIQPRMKAWRLFPVEPRGSARRRHDGNEDSERKKEGKASDEGL